MIKFQCPNCGQNGYVPDPEKGVHCVVCGYEPGTLLDGKLNTNREKIITSLDYGKEENDKNES